MAEIKPNLEEPKVYTAQDVSQGYTVLNTPLRKTIFFGGMILAVLVAIILVFSHH